MHDSECISECISKQQDTWQFLLAMHEVNLASSPCRFSLFVQERRRASHDTESLLLIVPIACTWVSSSPISGNLYNNNMCIINAVYLISASWQQTVFVSPYSCFHNHYCVFFFISSKVLNSHMICRLM